MTPRSQSEGPTGVLLVNLGSPDAPTPAAVRRFLDEFLSDPAVVKLNRVVWWLIRKLFILPRRGRSSAELYRSIWTEDGSPLVCETREQARLLDAQLGPDFRVVIGMRYGNPSLSAGLNELTSAGCRRVILIPMFPQFSNATTGSIETELARVLPKLSEAPEVTVAEPFFEDAGYVRALAASLRDHARDGDHHVFSFHGLPVSAIEAGDPYQKHCEATAEALATELGLADDAWVLTYQSRFGGEPWLEPDTAVVVPALASRGCRIVVSSPGFPADCLETLEELAIRLPESFHEAGGKEIAVVPCLNGHPAWIAALEGLVHGELARSAAGVGGSG